MSIRTRAVTRRCSRRLPDGNDDVVRSKQLFLSKASTFQTVTCRVAEAVDRSMASDSVLETTLAVSPGSGVHPGVNSEGRCDDSPNHLEREAYKRLNDLRRAVLHKSRGLLSHTF